MQNRGKQQENPLLESSKINITRTSQSKITVLTLSSITGNSIPWLSVNKCCNEAHTNSQKGETDSTQSKAEYKAKSH